MKNLEKEKLEMSRLEMLDFQINCYQFQKALKPISMINVCC